MLRDFISSRFQYGEKREERIRRKFRRAVGQIYDLCEPVSGRYVADVADRPEDSASKLFSTAEMIDDFVSRQGLVIPKAVAIAVALEAYVVSAAGEEDYLADYFESVNANRKSLKSRIGLVV